MNRLRSLVVVVTHYYSVDFFFVCAFRYIRPTLKHCRIFVFIRFHFDPENESLLTVIRIDVHTPPK